MESDTLAKTEAFLQRWFETTPEKRYARFYGLARPLRLGTTWAKTQRPSSACRQDHFKSARDRCEG
jgi:hypothetical protein